VKDEKYLNVFYYAMKDTLVIKDIKEATKVAANHQYRVVTINGEVIELSG
jgi:structural maintenance of chromosome 4